MILAVTSSGEKLQSSFSPHFGRAEFFVLLDTNNNGVSVIANAANLNMAQGAGQAAKRIVDSEVQVLITGHVGPGAFSALEAAKVQIYSACRGTVAELIEQFKAEQLKVVHSADVAGHP
jgi:predicted Fe-Mo cluster-binding NifX family protein